MQAGRDHWSAQGRTGSHRLIAISGPLLLALWLTGGAGAEALEPVPESKVGFGDRVEQVFDAIWGAATLVDDPDAPALRKLAIKGRLQADFPLFDSNQGRYTEAQIRRFRIGARTEWRGNLTTHVEIDVDFSCEENEVCDDDAFEGITDAWVGWRPHDAFDVRVGKLAANFTLDGSTSSRTLLTLERNNVANNIWFPTEYHLGARVRGAVRSWRYLVGAFASSTTEDFDTQGGAIFTLVTIGYDFAERWRVPEASLTFDYVYNEPDDENISTRDLEHVISLHLRYDSGGFGVRGELSGGLGYGSQPDLIGFAIMPFYHLNEFIEIVTRYTYLESFGPNGIRFSRYESRIDPGRGDRYNELFMGLNWYLYGHELKLQTGVKYTRMDDVSPDDHDYRGWGWTTGIRMSW